MRLSVPMAMCAVMTTIPMNLLLLEKTESFVLIGILEQTGMLQQQMIIGKRSEKNMENEKKFSCPCCGSENQLEEEGMYEICSVCGWEDDELQRDDPDYDVGANGAISLNQARKMWAEGKTLFPNHPNPKALG